MALRLQTRLTTHPPLRDQAYEVIKDAILTGVVKPGERMVEQQVANSLGLSRIPVREAFRRLQQEGYLIGTRSGLIVREASLQELYDLYAVRARLEGMAAAIAAERATEADVARLRKVLDNMAPSLESGNEQELTQASFEFHRQLYAILSNQFLVNFLTTLTEHLRRYRGLQFRIPHRGRASVEEDYRVLEAIARHDVAEADRLAQEHIRQLWAHVQALAHESPPDAPLSATANPNVNSTIE